MNKRTRAGLLPMPIFASMSLSARAKNQHFLAFIPILSVAKNLVISTTTARSPKPQTTDHGALARCWVRASTKRAAVLSRSGWMVSGVSEV